MDKDLLFARRLAEEDIDIPGVGTVRVRALSRGEVLRAQGAKGVGAMERVMVSTALIDPALTEDEVKRWQEASPAGELEPVTRVIQRLSGMEAGADKAAYKSDGGGSVAGVRDVPGAEAGDDGGPAAGGDAG